MEGEGKRRRGIRLTRATKEVTSGEFPHPSKELGKATAEAGHAYHGVGGLDAASLSVVQGEDEGSGREGEKAAGEFVINGMNSVWRTRRRAHSDAGFAIRVGLGGGTW